MRSLKAWISEEKMGSSIQYVSKPHKAISMQFRNDDLEACLRTSDRYLFIEVFQIIKRLRY